MTYVFCFCLFVKNCDCIVLFHYLNITYKLHGCFHGNLFFRQARFHANFWEADAAGEIDLVGFFQDTDAILMCEK